jgi:hypothetical protein
MIMWLLLLSSAILSVSSPEPVRPSSPNPPGLSREQAALLAQWYEHLGEPQTGQSYGDFLVRAARLKHHSPYLHFREAGGHERLQVDLAHFDCVSLIDSSLAVTRCAWLGERTEACFLRELIATRYRHGTMGEFPSRLHYLEDWLYDNRVRHRLEDLTQGLGGLLLRRKFSYMSENRHLFPAMEERAIREAIATTEARLSQRIYSVIVRSSVRRADGNLQNGDLVGVVTTEPGRLVGHAGFIVRDKKGTARLLHASSHHRRVVLTIRSLADYVLRRPERWGIVVARPLPPVPSHSLLATEEQAH